MKRIIVSLLLCSGLCAHAFSAPKWDVVVIPVNGVVDYKLARFLSHALKPPKDSESPVLYILEMDSFGGRVDAAFHIVDSVLNIDHGKLIAYVKSKAISAAAMLSLACDELYMHENATLGDCAPIIQSLVGVQEVGEKFQSPLRAKFRALASKNGYPVKLSEAMITKDMEVYSVSVNDSSFYEDTDGYKKVIKEYPESTVTANCVVKKGQLLTMNTREALDLGFSKKTVSSVEEILDDQNITDYGIRRIPAPKGFSFVTMSGFEKFYWFLAIPASLLFIIMTILTFIGLGESELADDFDTDVDVDVDVDGDIGDGLDADGAAADGHVDAGGHGFFDAFHLFTFRNFVVFFMIFGWTGIAMIKSDAKIFLTVIISFIAGLAMMFIVSFLFYLISKLVHSGNVSIKSAVGATGNVYLPIPEKKSGAGKVNVVVEGRKIEYKAMTKGKKILTGESIKVIGLVNKEIVLVEKQ